MTTVFKVYVHSFDLFLQFFKTDLQPLFGFEFHLFFTHGVSTYCILNWCWHFARMIPFQRNGLFVFLSKVSLCHLQRLHTSVQSCLTRWGHGEERLHWALTSAVPVLSNLFWHQPMDWSSVYGLSFVQLTSFTLFRVLEHHSERKLQVFSSDELVWNFNHFVCLKVIILSFIIFLFHQ